MWLPKLEYGGTHLLESEWKTLHCFLHRNLPLHRAPVIESLRLRFHNSYLKPEAIKMWVMIVVTRCLRELEISFSYFYPNEPDILPSNLYTCKSLVTLKLDGNIPVDVPRMVCLPCLKTLQLKEVTYVNEYSLQRLLSNCPVLENLLVEGCEGDNMRKFVVAVPSLLRLVLYTSDDLNDILINTPCLNYLELVCSDSKSHYCLIETMPKLQEACLSVSFPYITKLIGSIASVKRFTLCLENQSSQAAMHGAGFVFNQAVYADGFVFNNLVHLEICICERCASTVLVRLLKDSPNLRELELFSMEDHDPKSVLVWNEPSTVPKCMLSSLEAFKFSGYSGTPEERDLAIFILKNSPHLKTATILSRDDLFPTLDILKDLALSPRASTTCRLVFK